MLNCNSSSRNVPSILRICATSRHSHPPVTLQTPSGHLPNTFPTPGPSPYPNFCYYSQLTTFSKIHSLLIVLRLNISRNPNAVSQPMAFMVRLRSANPSYTLHQDSVPALSAYDKKHQKTRNKLWHLSRLFQHSTHLKTIPEQCRVQPAAEKKWERYHPQHRIHIESPIPRWIHGNYSFYTPIQSLWGNVALAS